jgi:hypothetical protein
MMISNGSPEERLFHLKRVTLSFSVESIKIDLKTDDCTVSHWIYICIKNADADLVSSNWQTEK